MIVEPEQRVADFAKAGADIISVHCEQSSTIHLHRTLNMIRDLGCKAGVVLNPGTPLSTLEYVLDACDLVLVMSVNPGFGGQKFIESQVDKIRAIRAMCDAKGLNPWIEVDGGVTPANAYKVIEAGCNAIVSGSGVFGAPSYKDGALHSSVLPCSARADASRLCAQPSLASRRPSARPALLARRRLAPVLPCRARLAPHARGGHSRDCRPRARTPRRLPCYS
jgi:hypothetical protein